MSAYTETIDRNLKGCKAVSVGHCPGCSDCPDEQDEAVGDEGGFSWSGCDCCGSSLGGDRYAAHFIILNDKGSVVGQPIHHMEVCVDCLCYLANGDEPENWEG